MALVSTPRSLTTDSANQSRSTSRYDTAKSHLDPFILDEFPDQFTMNESRQGHHETHLPPSVVDYMFFQPPGAALNSFLNGESTVGGARKSSQLAAPSPPDSLDNYTRYWGSPYWKENHLWADTPPKPLGGCRTTTAPKPRRALTLETIAERASYSTIATRRSLSSGKDTHRLWRAIHYPCIHGSRTCSAPCILVTTTDTAETYISSSKEQARSRIELQEKSRTANDAPITTLPALQFWTTQCSSQSQGVETFQDQVRPGSGTWPMFKAAKRTPAPSIRDIFQKLLASGFTSNSSAVEGRASNPGRESRFGEDGRTIRHESTIVDDLVSEVQSGIPRDLSFTTSRGQSEIRTKPEAKDSLLSSPDDSLAVAALKRLLLDNKLSTGFEKVDYNNTWKDTTSEVLKQSPRRFVLDGHPSFTRTQSTVSSVRDIAMSLRKMTLSDYSSTEEDVGVTLEHAEKTFAEFSASSSCDSSSTGLVEDQNKVCGVTQKQDEMGPVEDSVIHVSFNEPQFDQDIAIDRCTPPPSPHYSLTPSPLRPQRPKPIPNLSLFPAPEEPTTPTVIVNPGRWRSLSSLLRFSHRDPISKQLVHHYSCRHGHRIISTSTYSGEKPKSSLLHTEIFRTNAPESCWRCSAKDVCDKIWQKVSFQGLRQRQKRMRAVPLFIDPSDEPDDQSAVGTTTSECDRTFSRSNLKRIRIQAGERCAHGRTLRPKTSFFSKVVPRAVSQKANAPRIATRCKQCRMSGLSKGNFMKWVTRNIVLCGDTDESLDMQPCQVKTLRASSVRTLID